MAMKIHFVTVAAVALLLASATVVTAQPTGSTQLPGGLFGGGDKRNVREKLNFSVSVVEANDSDVPTELRGVVPTDTLLSGYSTMLTASADYAWQGPRFSFAASGASAMRYYSELESVQSASYTTGIGASAR